MNAQMLWCFCLEVLTLSGLLATNVLGDPMNRIVAPILAATLAVSASTAFAGGPVIIEDVVVEEKPASSVGILPLLLIPIILCVALCGGGDDEPVGKT